MEERWRDAQSLDVRSYTMSLKTRLELECTCTTCKLSFTIRNFEDCVSKDGVGLFISLLVCPNCELKTLDFDIVRRKIHE